MIRPFPIVAVMVFLSLAATVRNSDTCGQTQSTHLASALLSSGSSALAAVSAECVQSSVHVQLSSDSTHGISVNEESLLFLIQEELQLWKGLCQKTAINDTAESVAVVPDGSTAVALTVSDENATFATLAITAENASSNLVPTINGTAIAATTANDTTATTTVTTSNTASNIASNTASNTTADTTSDTTANTTSDTTANNTITTTASTTITSDLVTSSSASSIHRTSMADSSSPTGPSSLLAVRHISGAMSNHIFHVSPASPLSTHSESERHKAVLLRIYGTSAGNLIDHDKDMRLMLAIGRLGMGPQVLACFANGRLEEFIDSTTLQARDIRDPHTFTKIAQAFFRFHVLVKDRAIIQAQGLQASSEVESELWPRIFSWRNLAKTTFEEKRLTAFTEQQQTALERAGILEERFLAYMHRLKTFTDALASPVVFSHNDAQYGNILRRNSDGKLLLIDYEYAGFANRAYDLANFMCEWMANYSSAHPERLDPALFPTDHEQDAFLRAYLEEASSVDPTLFGSNNSLSQLKKEVTYYILCSHLVWGYWGVVQAAGSNIEFDYFSYGMQRFEMFNKLVAQLDLASI